MRDLIQTTFDLISRQSVTPRDEGCQEYMDEILSPLGFKNETMVFEDTTNMWARKGSQKPVFCFAGHTDVVLTGLAEKWKYPPFQPTIENGFIYGRGTADMKGSLAAMLCATERFVKDYPDHKGSIAYLITSDEEGPFINGTTRVIDTLESRNEKIDYCIVGEPSSTTKTGDIVKNGRRGSLTGDLTVKGVQGHVAYPHLSNNPINTLISICKKLKDKKLDKGNKNFQPSNLEFTAINVNNKAHNVIPARATAQFNIRYNNFHNANSLKKKINLIVKNICKSNKCNFKIQFIANGDSFLTKPERTIFMAKKIIKKVTKITPKFSTTGGTSDARFIRKIAPCLEFGLVGKTMHKVDECVSLSDLKNLTKIYHNILEEYFK